MNPNEIFEYVTEEMKWLAIGGGSYLGVILGSQAIFQTTLFQRKIQSKEELDVIINKEARKLNLDPTKIDANYDGNSDFARKVGINASYNKDSDFVRRNGNRDYLHLGGVLTKTIPTVKHELYHIHKGDYEKRHTLLKYLFINEPRATL